MRQRRGPDAWRRQIFRDRSLPDNVRVLLLFLADRIVVGENMKISVPQKHTAMALGISERRVGDRTKKAVEAQYLYREGRGQKGRTAVYYAVFPDRPGAARKSPGSRFQGARTEPAEDRFSRTQPSLLNTPLTEPAETTVRVLWQSPPVLQRDVLNRLAYRNDRQDGVSA